MVHLEYTDMDGDLSRGFRRKGRHFVSSLLIKHRIMGYDSENIGDGSLCFAKCKDTAPGKGGAGRPGGPRKKTQGTVLCVL